MTRKAKNFRTVNLLSSGAVVKFDPSLWLLVSSAKEFDETTTAILRVLAPRSNDRFMVYGVRSSGWDQKSKTYTARAEAYELVAVTEAVPDALAKVAAHCGVEALVAKLVARGER